MNRLSNIAHQSLLLGWQTLFVLVLLTVIGAGLLWLIATPYARIRWPIVAPLMGIALVTIIGVPLARNGLSIAWFAPVITLVGGLLSLTMLVRLSRNWSGRRILRTWLRLQGLVYAGIMGIVIMVSAILMTWGKGSSVRDVWGSGDFGAYWVVPDYLQHNGANVPAYLHQEVFRTHDVVDHFTNWSRLGSMVSLACVGALFPSAAIHHAITPSIVAAMVLMLGLAHCWLSRESPYLSWLVILVLIHPFLYFPLYFSYVSQAMGVILFITGLLVAGSRRITFHQSVIAGIFIGAACLHYPTMLCAAAVFWTLHFLLSLRNDRMPAALAGTVTALVVCGTYLPSTIHELARVARISDPGGWDWRGLIGSLEILGLRSVLGYHMPEPMFFGLRVVEVAIMVGFVAILWIALRHSRQPVAAYSLVITTTILTGIAAFKCFRHHTHASHGFVKTLSLFIVFLCLTAAVPVARWCTRLPSTVRSLTGGVLVFLIVGGQALALLRTEPQAPWYSSDLIQLTRRLLNRSADATVRLAVANPWDRKRSGATRMATGSSVKGLPDLYWEMAAPIVRDERRLVRNVSISQTNCFTILSAREVTPPIDAKLIADREGEYYAVPTSQPTIH